LGVWNAPPEGERQAHHMSMFDDLMGARVVLRNSSIDWFKGTITGNPYIIFDWENDGFL